MTNRNIIKKGRNNIDRVHLISKVKRRKGKCLMKINEINN